MRFIKNVAILDVGLAILAVLIAWLVKFDFGIILFGLGMLVGGIGAFLGGSDPTSPDNPKNLRFPFFLFRERSAQDLIAQDADNRKHSASSYEIENVLALAGLLAIVISIPFLFSIMFSK